MTTRNWRDLLSLITGRRQENAVPELPEGMRDESVDRMEFLLSLRRRGISDAAVLRAIDAVPREKFVLPGVSRQTAIDLARQEGLALHEADLDLYDAYNADEIFLTSTSLCICPVTKVNGVAIGPEGQVWGPVTRRIADAYQRFVNHDFVGQYMKRYVEGAETRAF